MNIRQLEIELDNAWYGHGNTSYKDKLNSVKLMGFKVFRNSEGRHKLKKTSNDFLDFFNSILDGGSNG